MIHLGDVTKIKANEIPIVDCVIGGSPCQNLSQAGNRKGLEGSESKLFLEQVRIVKEMRENARLSANEPIRPRFMVWENVAGAFNSNKGKDFQRVLTEIVRISSPQAPDVPMPEWGGWPRSGCLYDEMGKWSLAWRLHDAQWWGVPQRRKRIALLADFNGIAAPEIMFDFELWRTSETGNPIEPVRYSGEECGREIHSIPESLRRYIKTSNGTRKEAAGSARKSIGAADQIILNDQGGAMMDVSTNVVGTLRARMGGHVPIVIENHGKDARYTFSGDTSQTITAYMGTGDNSQPLVIEDSKVYGICSRHSNSMKSDNPDSGFYEAETTRTLDNNGGNPACNQGGMVVVEKCFDVRLTSDGTKNARHNVYETNNARTISTDGLRPDGNQGGGSRGNSI